MTKYNIDCIKHATWSASPNHGLTLIEVQRWEDDGGAIPTHRRRTHKPDQHVEEAEHELVAREVRGRDRF